MKSTKFIEYSKMIETEFANACIKHPKFCDAMLESNVNYAKQEFFIKNYAMKNADKDYATLILDEEIAEAMNAYQQGDKEHCLQELAQCGAVILRMMEFVDAEQ